MIRRPAQQIKNKADKLVRFVFLSGSRESPPEDGRASGAEPCLAQFVKRNFVGEQGIEPCLREPESRVLPAYSSPPSKPIAASYPNLSNQSRKIHRNTFLQCREGEAERKQSRSNGICALQKCITSTSPSKQSKKIRRNNFLQCREGDGRAKANFQQKIMRFAKNYCGEF